jgi:Ca-activated chloride channel family protein
MSSLWPYWLRPAWLLLAPLLGALLWHLWHRRRRTGRWQMILPKAFHTVLLRGGTGRGSRLPWVLLGLGWLLALLALLGPSWQRVEQTAQKPADPLVVLLQLTPEMLATDAPPNRLEQARRKLLDLLNQRRDAQTAIVVYAGSAHVLVPLSDDLATSRNLIDALKPSLMPLPGARADLAVRQALALLDQGALGQGRILLIGSQLSEQERRGIRQSLGPRSPRLLMLGMGTRDGAPVKQENGEFVQDPQGAILVAQLDSSSLKAFIEGVGGDYRSARGDDLDLRELGLFDGPQTLRNGEQTVQLDAWADQGYWLLLPLLLLAACAGRRGWLLSLALLWLAAPTPSYAAAFMDLWLRPDQQAARLLAEQRPAQAARRFIDPQWQGMALYEAGDYAGAASRFAQGNLAADHYNRGNALARSGALAAALEAYEQALERQPDLQPALINRVLVQRLIDEQQRGQNPAETPSPDSPPQPESSQPATPAPTIPGQADSGQASPGQTEPGPGTPGQTSSGQTLPAPARSPSTGNDPGTRPDGDAPEALPGPASRDAPLTQRSPGTGDPGDNPLSPTVSGPPSVPDASLSEAAPNAEMDAEQRQALEQWLRQIPDDPAELLRRKFWYEQQHTQDPPQ